MMDDHGSLDTIIPFHKLRFEVSVSTGLTMYLHNGLASLVLRNSSPVVSLSWFLASSQLSLYSSHRCINGNTLSSSID
jgi:hypothetical protein